MCLRSSPAINVISFRDCLKSQGPNFLVISTVLRVQRSKYAERRESDCFPLPPRPMSMADPLGLLMILEMRAKWDIASSKNTSSILLDEDDLPYFMFSLCSSCEVASTFFNFQKSRISSYITIGESRRSKLLHIKGRASSRSSFYILSSSSSFSKIQSCLQDTLKLLIAISNRLRVNQGLSSISRRSWNTLKHSCIHSLASCSSL